MALIDPSAERLMHLSSDFLAAQDTIKRQRRQLWGIAVALRAERMKNVALCDLLDELLSASDG